MDAPELPYSNDGCKVMFRDKHVGIESFTFAASYRARCLNNAWLDGYSAGLQAARIVLNEVVSIPVEGTIGGDK